MAFTTCVENRNFARHARYKNYLPQREKEKPHLGKSRSAPKSCDFEKVIEILTMSLIYREL